MTRVVLPKPAREAVATYAATTDATRERLARVRRLRPGKDEYPRSLRYGNEPRDIRAFMKSQGVVLWHQTWNSRANDVDRAIKLALYRGTVRDPKSKGKGYDHRPWTPVMQAADLEAQGVVGALALRAAGAPLTDAGFAVLTKAWRAVGLPLPPP